MMVQRGQWDKAIETAEQQVWRHYTMLLCFRFRYVTLRYELRYVTYHVFISWRYVVVCNKLTTLCHDFRCHFVAVKRTSRWLMTVMTRAMVAVSCLKYALCDNTSVWQYSLLCDTVALPSSFLSQGFEVLSKYVALYAANLIKDGNTLKALDLYCRYGAPANPQVNIFQQRVY